MKRENLRREGIHKTRDNQIKKIKSLKINLKKTHKKSSK